MTDRLNGKRAGLFLNCAASDKNPRGFIGPLWNSGWPHTLENVVGPLISKYEITRLLTHLPAGRKPDGPMSYDGFTEIDVLVRNNQHEFWPLSRGPFVGAFAMFQHFRPFLQCDFYLGSLVKDPRLESAYFATWVDRAYKAIEPYMELRRAFPQRTFGLHFDHICSHDAGVARVPVDSKIMDFLIDIGQHFRVYIEPHPLNDHLHFREFPWTTTSTHWLKAGRKRESQAYARDNTKSVTIIVDSPDHMPVLLNDDGVGTLSFRWAKIHQFDQWLLPVG